MNTGNHPERQGEVRPPRDVGERRRELEQTIAERTSQLSEANERYRSILNASPDDITIADLEGRILMVSPMAISMFRAPSEFDYLGRSVMEFIVPADRARALAHIAERRRGVITGPVEYSGLRIDGSAFPIEVNTEFIRNSQGVPTGMVVIARDITERRQAEEERNRLELQNSHLQKSESLGRMAGAIAHHFNNQLHSVMMNLEMAMDSAPLGAETMDKLGSAMRSARKAAEVSSLMLTYLGQSRPVLKPLDLSETCKSALSQLRASIPANTMVEEELSIPGPGINANGDQIRQLLANLVTNAWEAGGDGGGPVWVRVTTAAPAEILAVPDRFPIDWRPQERPYACLEVRDAGCGIPAADIDKLFDPFFSSKFAGRGLGLPVVLGIVRAHEGCVAVLSRPGTGSVFRVYIPISAEVVLPAKARVSQMHAPVRKGAVLLVDDDPAVLQTGLLALEKMGFAVHPARGGIRAVELFRRHQAEIAVVLCDVSMPGMGGWETLAALRKLAPGIPVILASGYSESEVMGEDHPERPQAFLHKPFELETMKATLSRLMDSGKPQDSDSKSSD